MHAAFQISGFFWSPIFVSYIWVSCGQEKFYNFFFYVCPFSSLVAHNTIAEQQGTKIGRFYYFSTVAGGGPDLTEIILAEIGIDFVVNYVAVIVKYEKVRNAGCDPRALFFKQGNNVWAVSITMLNVLLCIEILSKIGIASV